MFLVLHHFLVQEEGKNPKILDGGLSNYFKKRRRRHFSRKFFKFMMGFPTSTRSCFKIFFKYYYRGKMMELVGFFSSMIFHLSISIENYLQLCSDLAAFGLWEISQDDTQKLKSIDPRVVPTLLKQAGPYFIKIGAFFMDLFFEFQFSFLL